MNRNELIYLASPYSVGKGGAYGASNLGKATKNMKTRRYRAVCKKAAELMQQGYSVFSPIAHSHSIEVEGMDKIETGDFWLKQDFVVLERCDRLVVYTLPDWEYSSGIKREIEFAEARGIPVEYISDDSPPDKS